MSSNSATGLVKAYRHRERQIMTRASAKDQNLQRYRIKKQILIFTLRHAVFSFPHYLNSIKEQVLQTWHCFSAVFYYKVLTSVLLLETDFILT